MPLSHGKSKKAFSHNVEVEMRAGKPQKQAVAIAYSEKAKAEHRKHLAMGGYAGGGKMDDDELMMDHCTMELMRAIRTEDKMAFRDAMMVLVSDIIHKMDMEMEEEEES